MRTPRGTRTGFSSMAAVFALAVSLVLLIGGILSAQQAAFREDINGDGKVGILDVVALLLLGRNNPADPKADYDGNGTWSLSDAVALTRNIHSENLTAIDTTPPPPPPPPPPVNKTWPVQVRDNFFSPDSLAIAVGDTVRWTNTGNLIHTTTSGANGVVDNRWNSGNLTSGQSFSYVFAQAGVYPYYCIPHYFIGMVGKVVVIQP